MVGPQGESNSQASSVPPAPASKPNAMLRMICCRRFRLRLRAAAGGITIRDVTRMIPSNRMLSATVSVRTLTKR